MVQPHHERHRWSSIGFSRRQFGLAVAFLGFMILLFHSDSSLSLQVGLPLEFRDDALVTTNSTTALASTSTRWYPTRQWTENCVRNQEHLNTTYQPFQVQWPDYRLGDCILYCERCSKTMLRAVGKTFDSIAGRYAQKMCRKTTTKGGEEDYSWKYLLELFEHSQFQTWSKPDPDEIVIHLRLGDVVDTLGSNQKKEVTEILWEGANTRHAPQSIYQGGIKSITELLENVYQSQRRKVVIRGGPHYSKAYPKSRIYAACLRQAMQAAGLTVSSFQIENQNPDEDFYYLSHAQHLILASGGYSRLVGKLAQLQGGTLWGRTFFGEKDSQTGMWH